MASFDLDFACVGPQRTGTTWLYEMLRQHPELCLPGVVKETMFFDEYFERGTDWYAQYFDHAQPGQLCGEVAPTYFDDPAVPKRIRGTTPDCIILITLRNPIERAWSLFLHHLRKGRVSNHFWEAAETFPRIVDGGRYARHIPRWQSIFGTEQVTLLFLEDIRLSPEETLHSVQSRLGIKKMSAPKDFSSPKNDSSMCQFPALAFGAAFLTSTLHEYGFHDVVRAAKKTGLKSIVYSGGEKRAPEMSTSVQEQLQQEYKNDIAFIEKETGRDLSRWRC